MIRIYTKRDSTKLQLAFTEPLVIIDVGPSDTYTVKKLNENNGNYITTAHVSQLKIWKNTSLNNECFDEQQCESDEVCSNNDNDEIFVSADESSFSKNTGNQENKNEKSTRKRNKPKYLNDYVC
uniref:Uncharacterized protein n=1 Tax=Trichogramma kaykai TaxID=54128 RepID=A0ABD2XLG6_9HYME